MTKISSQILWFLTGRSVVWKVGEREPRQAKLSLSPPTQVLSARLPRKLPRPPTTSSNFFNILHGHRTNY